MSAEVMFRWNNTEVNLKLARFVVRLLAEHHGRLAAVGPTQCLRDILDWFKQCDPANDKTFSAIEAKYGANPDFDSVCQFLREYNYDDMKRLYPKQCGSLWMAVRGVMRRRTGGNADPADSSTMSSCSSKGSVDSGSVRKRQNEGNVDPASAIKNIRQGADEISFDLLMLLSNPQKLTGEDRVQLEQVEEKMMTALEDLRLVLRRLPPRPPGSLSSLRAEDELKDEDFEGAYNGSPESDYPSSPCSSYSGHSRNEGFANGNSNMFAWYANLTSHKALAETKVADSKSGSSGVGKSSAIKADPEVQAADVAAIEEALQKNKKGNQRMSVGKRTADGIVQGKIASALAIPAEAKRSSVERKEQRVSLSQTIKRLSKTHLNSLMDNIVKTETDKP